MLNILKATERKTKHRMHKININSLTDPSSEYIKITKKINKATQGITKFKLLLRRTKFPGLLIRFHLLLNHGGWALVTLDKGVRMSLFRINNTILVHG